MFYRWCADADIPELTTLAETIETWWPAIEVFLTTGITNARTEGTNRLIKQVKRAACGFRNRDNYRRRVRLHCTRQTRDREQLAKYALRSFPRRDAPWDPDLSAPAIGTALHGCHSRTDLDG